MKHCPQCSTGYPDTLDACPTHGLPLNEIRDLKPGMVVHHSYRIVRKLGQGGMGAVYLAQHTLMDEPRALKFLSIELSNDEAFTRRFLREVRTLRQLRHPNVVDCGDLESAEDGSLFFSMEFVDGPDLRGFLRDAPQPFDVPLALDLTRQIAAGLAAAHARGMVHRDIKPENILLAHDATGWQPKIADFGIVATKEASTAFTRTGGTLLTVAYAAPEQWRGTPAAQLDGRTDLYALGGLLYEMLTGQTPFHAESYEGWAQAHQTTPPPPPSALRPDLANWQGLDALVQRFLAKDREDRPKNVAELSVLLDAIQYLPPDMHIKTVAENAKYSRNPPEAKRDFTIINLRSIFLLGVLIILTWAVWSNFFSKSSTDVYSTPAMKKDTVNSMPMAPDQIDTAENEQKAVSLYNLKRYSDSKPLFEQACSGGNGDACLHLGGLYKEGQGVERNYLRASEFLSKGCDAGSPGACNDLGVMYEDGEGVKRDYVQAATLFTKACDANNATSCGSLGFMYSEGHGVEKNSETARKLFNKACSMGNEFYCNYIKTFRQDF